MAATDRCDTPETALNARPQLRGQSYSAVMKHLQIIRLVLMLAMASGAAAAQSADWHVLQGIPAGTKIKLILRHERTFGHCQLEAVSEDSLDCFFTALGSRRYARDEILEVRIGHHSARTGFFIGAAAGAGLGAANGSGGSSGRVLGVIVGVPVLGGIGAGIGAIVDPFVHGKTVYRSAALSAGKPGDVLRSAPQHGTNFEAHLQR